METCSENPLRRSKLVSCFGQLPQETLHDILSRLPVTSIIQMSFVCRSLSPVSRDPFLADYQLSRSLLSENECLIIHADYPVQNRLHFVHLSDEKVGKFDIPFIASVPDFCIIGSSNGLLCLIDTLYTDSIYLYNPFTRDYVGLPKNSDFPGRVIVYGFGFHPVINDYKVIKIFHYGNCVKNSTGGHLRRFTMADRYSSEVEVYSASGSRWECKGLLPYKLEKCSSPGVLLNGRLHWVSQLTTYKGQWTRLIVSYNLADDSFSEVKVPGSVSQGVGRWMSCYLGTLDGSLCSAVSIRNGALDVWVLKEYGVSESWVKEFTIGVYYPVTPASFDAERSYHICRYSYGKISMQILCGLKNGEVLLEYRGSGLVSYNPHNRVFKPLSFEGIPRIYQTILHTGSLKSPVLPR